MEIRVLEYFLTVVREGSISKAAKVLHITQPTLSRQLAQLEDDSGVRLFQRGARQIELTNEGILLRRRAEEILALVEKTERELALQEEQIEGVISIGSGETAAVQTLAKACKAFSDSHPRVQFDLYTANADHIREQIENGLLDIGLLLEPADMASFDFIRLTPKERWVALMRTDHPLAAKDSVTAADLKRVSLILPRRSAVQSELANWFGQRYRHLNILVTSNLSTNGAIMVRNGFGCSLVIEGSVPFWSHEEVTYRPLSPELSAASVIAWKRDAPHGMAAGKFIEFLHGYLDAEKGERL